MAQPSITTVVELWRQGYMRMVSYRLDTTRVTVLYTVEFIPGSSSEAEHITRGGGEELCGWEAEWQGHRPLPRHQQGDQDLQGGATL